MIETVNIAQILNAMVNDKKLIKLIKNKQIFERHKLKIILKMFNERKIIFYD